MTTTIDCVICFEMIGDKNCLTTECGHKFHTSCMMKNIKVNGFGCPCCRTLMAEKEDVKSEDEQDDDDVDEEAYSLFDDELSSIASSEYSHEMIDQEDMLRAFRMFTNRSEGQEPEPEDVLDELVKGEEQFYVPTINSLTKELVEDGITMNEVVAMFLREKLHGRYDTGLQYNEETMSKTWNRMAALIVSVYR